MALQSYLKDWALHYIRHMDAFERSIVEIKDEGDRLLVRHRKKEQVLFPVPELNGLPARIPQGSYVTIITLNTKANVEKLVRSWAILAKEPRLKILFINPDSATERKWAICPNTHSKVSDDDSLKLGLMSLFNTVEPVTEAEMRKMEKAS